MYESFFGFTAKPFQLTPDAAFFYASRGHRRAMSYLEYGLHQAEGFIVITGDVGAGKTTILRALLARIPSDRIVAAQIVSTQLESDDMVRAVARAYGLADARADKATVMHRLERFFVELVRKGRRALLIVDEAQNLTPGAIEELRMLSNIQIGKYPPIQSFLVGQPEFRQMMRSDAMQQLRQRVIASYHLGPLEADETPLYIEHRLRVVGWNGTRPAIDQSAYEAVHQLSGGVPRRINALLDRVLLAVSLEERNRVVAPDVTTVAEELERELGVAQAADAEAAPLRATARENLGARDAVAHLAGIRAHMASIERLLRQLVDERAAARADAPAPVVAPFGERDAAKGPVSIRRAGP